MSEPTIDEMLAWLDEVVRDLAIAQSENEADFLEHAYSAPVAELYDGQPAAIRAILEHQRLVESPVEKIQLTAIRAFVERVDKRLPEYNTGKGADSWLREYHKAVLDELEAMEKEAE